MINKLALILLGFLIVKWQSIPKKKINIEEKICGLLNEKDCFKLISEKVSREMRLKKTLTIEAYKDAVLSFEVISLLQEKLKPEYGLIEREYIEKLIHLIIKSDPSLLLI